MKKVLKDECFISKIIRNIKKAGISEDEVRFDEICLSRYIYGLLCDGQVYFIKSINDNYYDNEQISIINLRGNILNSSIKNLFKYYEIFEFESQLEFLEWGTNNVK